MRKIWVLGAVLVVAACGGNPNVPPTVTWQYGAGNGDPMPYPGPTPVYSRSYGLGADVPVSMGGKPTVQYGYGAENESGVMVQSPAAPAPQRLAAPASDARPATSSHS